MLDTAWQSRRQAVRSSSEPLRLPFCLVSLDAGSSRSENAGWIRRPAHGPASMINCVCDAPVLRCHSCGIDWPGRCGADPVGQIARNSRAGGTWCA